MFGPKTGPNARRGNLSKETEAMLAGACVLGFIDETLKRTLVGLDALLSLFPFPVLGRRRSESVKEEPRHGSLPCYAL